MVEKVTVCNRCGSTTCVGKPLCDYDGLPHETADVPKYKLDRHTAFVRSQAASNKGLKPRKLQRGDA